MEVNAAKLTKPPPAGLAPWQERRVARHVSEHLGRSIRIADLAGLAGLGIGRFLRRFRHSFGVTPYGYVIRSRLEHAKTLLRQTGSPLCQIALASDFSDQSHMSRSFQAIVGSTPMRWRRKQASHPAPWPEPWRRRIHGAIVAANHPFLSRTSPMIRKTFAFALAFALAGLATAHAQTKPTVVVHGAFADSSSWNGVVADLTRDGYPVVAVANPLRGLASDAAAVRTMLDAIPGPVILVGHSYGGAVISAASDGAANVKALVYVAAFAPEVGESVFELSGKFPGGTLPGALDRPVDLPGGAHDLYIQQDKFPTQFAADVPLAQARLMAVAQRPLNDAAGAEKAVATG